VRQANQFGDIITIGDFGVQFIFTFYQQSCSGTSPVVSIMDISAATLTEITFKKPGGATLTVTASFVTDGTDGQITYTSNSTDIDQVGGWLKQASVTLVDGFFSSPISSFKVVDVL